VRVTSVGSVDVGRSATLGGSEDGRAAEDTVETPESAGRSPEGGSVGVVEASVIVH